MNRFLHRLVLGSALAWAGIAVSACGGDDTPPDAEPVPDAAPEVGTINLEWEIVYMGNPLTCADVGANTISIRFTPSQGGSGTAEALSCSAMGATTSPIDSGTYDVEVSLINGSLQDLAVEQMINDVEIVTGQSTALGTLTFEVEPRGTIDFTINAEEDGLNCDPDTMNGAGITELRIEFMDSQGACVPTTFTIEAGATQPAGEYMSDCAGSSYGCIENDQAVSAVVPSGPSSMVFTGYKGVEECHRRTGQFDVSGGNLITELIEQYLMRDRVPACDPPPP